ncbi:hypothetical protein CYMTET_52569 [Cymbomonas tetramitiformis]|uniref:SURP motif domain-containing protein n=1 Tax=Cymbomonas tetramitiformis TaxID=36881 RepID=A0AAE0ERI2_9CHLO|nr:hypothetical protein CYMTET_52569 [Cymbomonas tetramitiformis]
MTAAEENGADALPVDAMQITTTEVSDEPKKNIIDTGKPLESVKTHTKSVGIIHPPPDIRSIVDKTAQFVGRNGPEFEKRILANEKNNAKFNFLIPTDPYHPYYRFKVDEARQEDGGIPDAAAAAPAAPSPAAPAAAAAPVVAPVLKALEAPEPEKYTVSIPDGLTPFEVDMIKLTAQFVARNGKSFLTGLTSREHSNPSFNFLKPTHSLFTFFTALADAYSKVLMPPKSTTDRIRNPESKPQLLDRCLRRLEWERTQERAKQEAEDRAEKERDQMAMIDWHDFVVVETIEFDPDEDESLPGPMTPQDIVAAAKREPVEEAEEEEAAEEGMEMEMDEAEMEMVKEAEEAEEETPAPFEAPEPQMKIVRNYKRAEPGVGPEVDSTKYVVSPITGEQIPVDQMAEHMRISLIDPKYKEQKDAMLAKLRDSTVAGDDEITRNIVRLAKTRPDVFGTTEEEVSVAVKQEIEKLKMPAPPPALGMPPPPPSSTMSLEEQIAAIHKAKKEGDLQGVGSLPTGQLSTPSAPPAMPPIPGLPTPPTLRPPSLPPPAMPPRPASFPPPTIYASPACRWENASSTSCSHATST